MQFTIVLASILSVVSAAAVTKRMPAKLVARQSGVCGALSTPLCCDVDVLGVADLNCENAGTVTTTDDFDSTCADIGKIAMCCVLPLLGDGLLCTSP